MTEYARSTSVASYQVVVKGSQATFSVEDVSPSISLPTSPTIELRQGNPVLAFVSITNGATSASVAIDATSVSAATYTLKLESYDSSIGSTEATLKTDTVTIYVIEYVRSKSVASY